MKTMEGMSMKKRVKKPGAPDVTHNSDLIAPQAHIPEGLIKGVRNSFMGAARAKRRWSALV